MVTICLVVGIEVSLGDFYEDVMDGFDFFFRLFFIV
jgi:hypothetical protein